MSDLNADKLPRFTFVHKCELQKEFGDLIPTPSPYDPPHKKFFHRMRTIFTVEANHYSKKFFRSHSSLSKEQVRHFTTKEFRYVIHPLSNIVESHHIFMTFIWLIAFLTQPFFGTFYANYLYNSKKPNRECYIIFEILLNFVMLLDVFVRFRIGYIQWKTRELVLSPQRIAQHYLLTFFVFDMLPVIVIFIVNVGYTLPFRTKLVLYQVSMLRYARIRSMGQGVGKILRIFGLTKGTTLAVLIYLYWMIYIHWWTCGFKLLNTLRDEHGVPYNSSWLRKLERQRRLSTTSENFYITNEISVTVDYLHYCSVVICHFFGAEVGMLRSTNSIDMMMYSILLTTSLIIYLISLAFLLQYFGLINISESRYEEIAYQAEHYMFRKRFPTLLRKRLQHYYDYKFNKKFFSEEQILNTLSSHLQMEILLHSCHTMIGKVQLFEGLSKGAIGCILALLKQEIFLPNDVIMRSDDDDDCLYFILFGTCGVMLLSGKEATHIEDGNFFGENAKFARNIEQDFLYQVVALEPCEIYTLGMADVEYCCTQYPEIKHKFEKMSIARSKYYTQVLGKAAIDDDTISVSDILEELRRKKVLDQGRRRRGRLGTRY